MAVSGKRASNFISSDQELERLHAGSDDDDLYELVQAVKHNVRNKGH